MTGVRTARVVALGLCLGATFSVAAAADGSKPQVGDLRKVGSVHLETSCTPAVKADFARGVALLHSFFYEEARRVFADVAAADPRCAMAHWGVAMTWWHPIWTPPAAEEMSSGRAAIDKATTIGGQTPLERGFIRALDAFYQAPAKAAAGPIGQSCHGPTGGADHAARALAHEKAMGAVFTQHPDNVEAATFYALALLATAPPTDQTLKNQSRATQILETFYKKNANHPGIIHYLIHGYDYPSVAQKGLAAAKAYAEIAPWVPHALHMPSHIFTRLGMWGEVVGSNMASADASRQNAALHHADATSFEELHALDYLVYAYLQTAQDESARVIVEKTKAVRKTSPQVDFAVAYAMGAVPARYALERRQWAEAAALKVPPTPSWDRYSFGAAHVAFAQAFGSARAGRAVEARAALERLRQLEEGMTDPRQQYFARQTAMQRRVVEGWLAVAEGRKDEGEKLLREAADADDALGKHPVSPGSLLPAREILADFLLEQGRAPEALAEFEKCLKLSPGRLNSLYGAGRAAELSKDVERARRYYGDLVAMVAKDAARPELAKARAFLSAQHAASR